MTSILLRAARLLVFSGRIESIGNVNVTGPTVPPAWYNYTGLLTDTDDRTGSRSTWMTPASSELPRYLRYELLADRNGTTVLYSDDAAISNVAASDPGGAIYLRFQGARVDASTGAVLPATAGPWRVSVGDGPNTLNSDRAEALRFDLVLDKSQGPIQVRELRVVWR